MVLGFRRDDRHKGIAQRAQGDEALFPIGEAATLECHRLTRLDHLGGVGQVETLLVELARLLCGIEAVAHDYSVCITICIVKQSAISRHFAGGWSG